MAARPALPCPARACSVPERVGSASCLREPTSHGAKKVHCQGGAGATPRNIGDPLFSFGVQSASISYVLCVYPDTFALNHELQEKHLI